MTYWEPQDDAGGARCLFICAYGSQEKYLLARQESGCVTRTVPVTQAFDIHGSRILESAGKCDFIVMDELGTLESEALVFQDALMRRIDGDVPVLGVLKDSPSPLLDKIRAHPKVTVREVTIDNRAEVLQWLIKQNPYL